MTRLGFAELSPDEILQALDAVGLPGDGRQLQLNSYENRVFQAFLESDEAVVLKFYRPGRWSHEQILEEHRFAAELAAAEVPVVAPWSLKAEGGEGLSLMGSPPTLALQTQGSHGWRYSVSPRKAGRGPELEDEATLRWIGRFLGRLHTVGSRAPFAHRRTLTVQTLGWDARTRLQALECVSAAEAPAWNALSEQALQLAQTAFDRLGPLRPLRLHGDCHPGNILWREEGPHVVDLDDACNGPAVQDLWMLLSGDAEGAQRQLECLLEGYRQFRDFDEAELQLIEPLRTLRMIHHAAWIADRWEDPAFPRAFPWFGTPAYWSQLTTQLREQIEKMADA